MRKTKHIQIKTALISNMDQIQLMKVAAEEINLLNRTLQLRIQITITPHSQRQISQKNGTTTDGNKFRMKKESRNQATNLSKIRPGISITKKKTMKKTN
jgi:hypothetical protein